MRLTVASTLSLALGAAAYFPNPAQQPLGTAENKLPSFLSQALDQVKTALGNVDVSAEAAQAWTEIAKLYPEDTISAIQAMTSKSQPKDNRKRRPDSSWDYIVKGDEMMSAMSGKIDGHEKLKGTKLRIKKPNGLGIDEDVKQYSGYLDVEDDKHFFFCKFSRRVALIAEMKLIGNRVLRVQK
jgi:cathepsin A (carboxypeptidase C)